MVSRTMGGASLQVLSWDVLSNLSSVVNTQGTAPATDDVVHTYLYDASGQRFAQLVNSPDGVADTATVYMGGWEATDPNTGAGSTGDTVLTRLYSVGGAQVAHAEAGSFTFVLGDVQGSAQVAVTGTSAADAGTVTRNAYTPYGMTRDADHLTSTRGWLNQHEDTTTGLTYLNARYYDPALGRFLTPDPLMNPGDPRTLDPYRYADNNPTVYTDASGLSPSCGTYSEATRGCWTGFQKVVENSGAGYAHHGSQVASAAKYPEYDHFRRSMRSTYKPFVGVGPCQVCGKTPTVVHVLLDLAGMVPVIGELADGINASLYARDGAYADAAVSGAATVPFFGWFATGGKYFKRLNDWLSQANKAPAANSVRSAAPSAFTRTEALSGRASQRTVNEIAESMRTNGWQGAPIDVVELNGERIVVDGHHRLAAARRVGIDVQYQVVDPSTVIGPGKYTSIDDILQSTYSVGRDRLR
jgi:RHS repeat-associated protein